MKNYVSKKLIDIEKKILSKFKKTKKNYFSTKILINFLIYLNLKTEKLLYLKDYNPENEILREIEYLNKFIIDFNMFDEFSVKKTNQQNFNLEKNHQSLFQKLWLNFNYNEFKKERLGRYIRRIKLNKLQKFITNKKVVDFGCGHGSFLMSMTDFKPNECIGIDYGKDSIEYANSMKRRIFPNKKIFFYERSVYKSKLKKNYFDFAIQNGVFHHLKNENLAYREVYRVLKPDGFFWVYTDGGGGLRDFVWDLSQKLLQNIDNDIVQNQIRSSGLSTNKEYHLGDGLSARYRHTDLPNLKDRLGKIGFKFVKQLRGGFKTDIDFPYYKDKYFKKKFGSGDLRILFKKI